MYINRHRLAGKWVYMRRLVIFDLWQTLVDLSTSQGLREMIQGSSSCDIDEEAVAEAFRTSDLYCSAIDLDSGLEKILTQLCVPIEEHDRIIQAWRVAPRHAVLVGGALDLLKRLQDKCIPLAILTNIDRYGFEHFRYPELLKLFDWTFPSFEMGICKPNPRCWDNIRKVTGFSYSQMTMIGDSLKEDIESANNLGMNTILVNRADTPSLSIANYTYQKLLDVPLGNVIKKRSE